MNSATRDKILKSWSAVSEVALIKEVATKGEPGHIQLCIEFWAKKRKLPVADYELYFHDIVQTYVQRLLTERLVCKAEIVLCNVQRSVKCFYYQFACECTDVELRELLLEYLSAKDPHGFTQDMQELQFYWELLQQIQASPNVLAKCKKHLRRRINLETLMSIDPGFQQSLMAELYFENDNIALLQRLNKLELWNFLVDTQRTSELIRWCCLSVAVNDDEQRNIGKNYTELELMYCQWHDIEPEMFEYALKTLNNPSDVLRNCFVRAGFFFEDERKNVALTLHRIATTESFQQNANVLEKLPISHFLMERGCYELMLREFVSTREIEEMIDEFANQSEICKMIVTLKSHDLSDRLGFEKIAYAVKVYLEDNEVDFQREQLLVTFFDFLCNEPTIASLNCFLFSSALKHVPYLKAMAQRLENGKMPAASSIPTPYDLLRKFKDIDFKEICKDTHEVASFSNERLCQKYGSKYQLNFRHYLKQQRSCYAVYYLLMEHLSHMQITPSQLFSACETVTELTLQHAFDADLITHCICFIEQLGFDTQNLRNFLKLSHFLEDRACVPSYERMIEQVERLLLQRLIQAPDSFPLMDYQALMRIVACNQYRKWPELIMRRYANEDNWWRLLVLLQYFNVPLNRIKELTKHFNTHSIGEHLLRALLNDPSTFERIVKRNSTAARHHKKTKKMESMAVTTSVETITSSISSCTDANTVLSKTSLANQQLNFLPDNSGNLDLFAIILLSTSTIADEDRSNAVNFIELLQDGRTHSTTTNFLKNCIQLKLPILSLLAATANNTATERIDWNWIVWLAVATDQWTAVMRTANKNVEQLMWHLIENSIRQGNTILLHRSFSIFFEDNPLVHFFKFLQLTQHAHDFSEAVVDELRLYLLAWSNDVVALPPCTVIRRQDLMERIIKLLLVHFQCNFNSTLEQQRFIGCICKSGMCDISGHQLDFCVLHAVFVIMQNIVCWPQLFPINFEKLLNDENREYENLLSSLLEAKEYDLAIRLSSLLHLPISNIVYSKWVAELDDESQLKNLKKESVFQRYEEEIMEHSLPPELLVNFFLYAASRETNSSERKYLLFLRALTVIKKHHLFPNESFDRDQIEYEMIVAFLQIDRDDEPVEELEMYHSEYYEQIMLKERCVLYKSFLELKELAGIEDLTISARTEITDKMQAVLEDLLNRLLDKGDIVEALRLQELFDCRPICLRFVVFCMALAEGVTTIFSMSVEERQLLRDIEKSSFAKFNRRTLDSERTNCSLQGHSSPLKSYSDLSDSCSTLEFEEIPSREKRETLDTIQGIASKLKYGVNIGKRIVMAYRAAMYLDKEYLDVLRTKDVSVLLQSVCEESCLHRLMVVNDILTSTHMTSQEIAELLSFEMTTAVVRPRFYIFSDDQQARTTFKNADLWGYNIDRDLHLFLELTPNTTKLGNCLLEYCDALKAYRRHQDNKPYEHSAVFEKLSEIISKFGLPSSASSTTATAISNSNASASATQVLSHKKQNLICVELLIKAHQCFVHECSMEGIANVLNRTKALSATLTRAKSWSLIVRMLIGIARYREMFYCFDALIENEQFESLLGQFDEEKAIGLRQAILTYLREYCPENGKEYLKLAALHFLMYKDLAEMWQHDAKTLISKIIGTALVASAQLVEQSSMVNLTTATTPKIFIPKLRSSPHIIEMLHQAMGNYTHAAENYLLDNKLLMAQKSASMAEMLAMQIDLATKALEKSTQPHQTCVCVINIQTRDEFCELVNSELSVPQAIILGSALDYDINWTEALLSQYIIQMKKSYMYDYLAYFPITDNMIQNIVKGYQIYAQHQKTAVQLNENLLYLVDLVKSITLKYKLASLLNIKSTVMSLINDQTSYYLKDTNYGSTENRDTDF